MGEVTEIGWTDHTFNPWVGCTKVSEGCLNCYAETLNVRWKGNNWGPGAPRRRTSEAMWKEPLKWNRKAESDGKRHRVFCASMADVFDAEAPKGALADLWDLIRRTPMLDWQLLTKRPERILESLPEDWGRGYANVWMGASVENQKRANERIPTLMRVPAKIRFLSCEPLLGPIDLRSIPFKGDTAYLLDALGGTYRPTYAAPEYATTPLHLGMASLGAIHWVIPGGESGSGARPMQAEWALNIIHQAQATRTPVFFKQWGMLANNPDPKDATARENKQGGATKGGHLLFGEAIQQFPEVRA